MLLQASDDIEQIRRRRIPLRPEHLVRRGFWTQSGNLPYNENCEPRRAIAMPQAQTARAARLEARISPDLKRRLEYAASLRGATLTEFVVQSAQEAATRTIRENEILTLSERARVAFAELLVNPPHPNRKAIAAAKRYKEQFVRIPASLKRHKLSKIKDLKNDYEESKSLN
jgi:uncharacterized protein (DUF1778 family)